MRTIQVTPELAAVLLKTTKRNRSVNDKHVLFLASEMTSGRWVDTGECLKFSETGRLLDGQHRLLAIIKSGTTLQLRVVDGLSEDSQLVMDTGKARGVRHNLAMLGMENSTAMAALGRALYFAESMADIGMAPAGAVSTAAVLDVFSRWNLDRVKSTCVRVRQAPPSVAVAGVEAIAVMASCIGVGDEFIECMVVGEGPQVFRRLREQLLRMSGRGGGFGYLASSMTIAARSVRAFVEGEDLKILRSRPEDVKWLVERARTLAHIPGAKP